MKYYIAVTEETCISDGKINRLKRNTLTDMEIDEFNLSYVAYTNSKITYSSFVIVNYIQIDYYQFNNLYAYMVKHLSFS